MTEEELKKLTTEKLKERVIGHKTLIGFSIGMGLLFAYFIITDYLNGKEIEMFSLMMIAVLFIGISALLPELKATQKELASR